MDHISNMLTSILNASAVNKDNVTITHNKVCEEIVKILMNNGYCADYTVEGEVKKTITIQLKYEDNGRAVIRSLRRISKSSLRRYTAADSIPDVKNGLGLLIVSTNQGIMTGRQARKANLGGEVLVAVDE